MDKVSNGCCTWQRNLASVPTGGYLKFHGDVSINEDFRGSKLNTRLATQFLTVCQTLPS